MVISVRFKVVVGKFIFVSGKCEVVSRDIQGFFQMFQGNSVIS